MYDHAGIALIIVTEKVSSHCSVIVMFDVIDMTLESVNDSIFCLAYIFDVAPVTFQAIYEIVALACALGNSFVGSIIFRLVVFPNWDSLVQY